jgi:hypothetical protein
MARSSKGNGGGGRRAATTAKAGRGEGMSLADVAGSYKK